MLLDHIPFSWYNHNPSFLNPPLPSTSCSCSSIHFCELERWKQMKDRLLFSSLFLIIFYQKLIIFSKNRSVTEYCQRLWVVYHIFPLMHYNSLAWCLLLALLKYYFLCPQRHPEMTAASSADRLSQHPMVCPLCATLYQWCPVLYIPFRPGCAALSLTVLYEIMEKGNSFWEPLLCFP